MYVPFTQFPPIVIPCTVQYQNQAADTGIIHSILNFHLHVCVCESTTHTGAFSQHYNQHAELPHHYKAPSCIATSFPFLQLLILAITSLFSISKILSFQKYFRTEPYSIQSYKNGFFSTQHNSLEILPSIYQQSFVLY